MIETSTTSADIPPSRDGVPFACVISAWRTHEGELRGYLVHRLGDPHLAEDVLQDVFVKAMRQGQAFCSLEQPRAWLFQVARNALVDHARAQRPTVPVDDELPAAEASAEPIDLLANCIDRVLPQLDAADQDVLRECDLRGMRQQAFADSHGLTLTATKARLLRARQRLRVRLIETCAVEFDDRGNVCCSTAPAPPDLR